MIWLCDILSRSNMASRSYGPDTVFRYMSTVTLTSDISPWIMVMIHYWVMVNNCVKYIQIQHGSEELLLGHEFWVCVYSDLDSVQDIIQIELGSEEIWSWHRFSVYVHCDHDLEDMTFGQGHDIALGHGQQVCKILSSWYNIIWCFRATL